jgi:hypothetical protein
VLYGRHLEGSGCRPEHQFSTAQIFFRVGIQGAVTRIADSDHAGNDAHLYCRRFAHRAFCARLIRRRAAADMVCWREEPLALRLPNASKCGVDALYFFLCAFLPRTAVTPDEMKLALMRISTLLPSW